MRHRSPPIDGVRRPGTDANLGMVELVRADAWIPEPNGNTHS